MAPFRLFKRKIYSNVLIGLRCSCKLSKDNFKFLGEMKIKKFSVGVIGLGRRGLELIESMMACPECEVAAISDL